MDEKLGDIMFEMSYSLKDIEFRRYPIGSPKKEKRNVDGCNALT